MALTRALAGGRFNCLRNCTSASQISLHANTRLFSTVGQRWRPTYISKSTTGTFRSPPVLRNYWWSSKPTPNGLDAVSKPIITSEEKVIPAGQPPTTISEAIEPSVLDPLPSAPASSEVGIPSSMSPVQSSTVQDLVPDITTGPLDTLLNTPPPLHFGDFSALGLTSWTPAGLIRWTFEIINVATGLPWFWTIVAGTIFWRAIMTPFVIENLRNTGRLLPLTERTMAVKQELDAARKTGNTTLVKRLALKQKKIYDDAGVNMGMMFLAPAIQVPVALGLFFGIRKMCTLPVEQLKYSGVDFWPDLTIADPTYVLPVAAMLAINWQISVNSRDINLVERPEMGHIMNGFRLLTVLGLYLMSNFPSGLMISLVTTSLATIVQSLILRYPQVRKSLNIPIIPPRMQGKMPTYKESWAWLKKWYKDKMKDAERQALANKNRRR